MLNRAGIKDRSDQHRADHGHGIGLEQIGRHAGTVANIVADIIRNHRGIAGVVFRDTGFDLTDQVRTDIGALGKNSAAKTRKDGN